MNTQTEWIEHFPLPVLIADEQGIIQAYNQLFSTLCDSCSIETRMQTEKIFAQWEVQSPDTGLVEIGNNHFMLLRKDFSLNSKNLLLYFLVDGTQVYRLKEHNAQLDKMNNELDTIIENSYDVIYITVMLELPKFTKEHRKSQKISLPHN